MNTATNPFDPCIVTGETLSMIVKALEKRWGLTLVSFVGSDSIEQLVSLQEKVAALCRGNLREARQYIEFYESAHFHCTHFTLTRSDPEGPLRASAFLKQDHDLYELFQIVTGVAASLCPIQARFTSLTIKPGEFGLILSGECLDDCSALSRKKLIEELNRRLPCAFNISAREWDTDISKARKMHCALGYVKRPPPGGYDVLVEEIRQQQIEPILLKFDTISLVHHSRRSLAPPQEGAVSFRLGETLNINRDDFIAKMKFAD